MGGGEGRSGGKRKRVEERLRDGKEVDRDRWIDRLMERKRTHE